MVHVYLNVVGALFLACLLALKNGLVARVLYFILGFCRKSPKPKTLDKSCYAIKPIDNSPLYFSSAGNDNSSFKVSLKH